MSGWPTIDLVRVTVPASADRDLGSNLRFEVPRQLFGDGYRVFDAIRMVDRADGRALACFAESKMSGILAVSLNDGTVLRLDQRNQLSDQYVNQTVQDFLACCLAVMKRFPFYSADDDEEAMLTAATDLREALMRIDPHAVSDGTFWDAFISDVMVGDYSTEEVLHGLCEDSEDT